MRVMEFDIFVAELTGDTQAERATEAYRKISVVHRIRVCDTLRLAALSRGGLKN